MVDLPKVPRRLVTVEEPRSGLSARDIAAPYASIGEALKDTSEALTATADAHVADAAAKAVTVGADGEINVTRAAIPMVGPVGAKYERLIAHGAVVEADTLADRDLIDLRQQSRGDPNAFRSAAEAYRDDRVASLSATVGPAAGVALKRQMDSRITQSYGSLVTEHQNKAIARANESIDARILTLGNEMETLARRGGIGPEYEERMANVRALLEEKVSNPLLAYPREKADAYLDTLTTRVQGAAIHEQMERVYRERGFEAARTYLRSSARDLDGRVKQVDQIERTGLAWLRSEEAGFRGERDAMSREWAAARGQAATLPRESLIDIRDRARALGASRVASDVDSHMQALDVLSVTRSLPASERAMIAVTGTLPQNLSPAQRGVQATVENEARRQGVDPGIANAIAWRESRMGANTVAATSTARGPFQLIEANRQRLGLGPDATEADHVRAGVQMVKETTDTLRTSLGREPTAAEVYMGHFQGAGAAAAIIRAAPDADLKATLDAARPQFRGPNGESWGDTVIKANPFLAQLGTVGNFRAWAGRAMGVEGRTDLTETRGGLLALGMMKREMGKEITGEITALRQTIAREEFPPLADVMALGEKVHAIGTPEQQREVNELVAIAKVGQQYQSLSAPQRAQMLSEIDNELRTNGSSRFDSRLRANLRKADADITTAYKTDPYGAYSRFGQGPSAQATPAVNFGDPATASAIFGVRVKQQGIIRDEQGIGPFSVLRPAEAEAFRGLLATGDAKAVVGALGVLNGLPEDVLAATLKDERVKAGITSAIHTTDPAKMTAVMSNLDVWYRRDPQAFNTRFGPEAWNALKTWESTLRYMTPEQFTEHQTRALDPNVAELRKKHTETGETEARKMKPEQVIALTQPFFSAFGLNQSAVPTDPMVRDLMMADFVELAGRRFADTLDKDTAHSQAAERLAQKWVRSPLNGNEVMLRAPETVYPAVNGEHAWMTPQLEAAIAERLGVPMRQTVPSMAPGQQGKAMVGFGPRNWDYRIVADPTTEQEAQRYDRRLPISDTNKPPSYMVRVYDNRRVKPGWEVLPQRFAFDPNSAQDTARYGFGTRQAADVERRESFGRRMEATPSAGVTNADDAAFEERVAEREAAGIGGGQAWNRFEAWGDQHIWEPLGIKDREATRQRLERQAQKRPKPIAEGGGGGGF